MDIVYLLTKFPPVGGGSGSAAYNVAKELSGSHDILVITQQYPGLPKEEERDGFRIKRIRVPAGGIKGFAYLVLSSSIQALCRQADVIHYHDITMAAGNTILSRLSRSKTIVKYGGDFVYEYLSMRMPRGWNPVMSVEKAWSFSREAGLALAVEKDFINQADVVYSNTAYGANLLGGITEKNIGIVRNGVDEDVFSPARFDREQARRELGFSGTVYFVASRLINWKGVGAAIGAFRAANIRNSMLAIAGDGPHKEGFAALAGGDSRIRFLGNVDWNSMPYYLAGADVFVLPSYLDWCPNAMLEAMSMGKTVIAPRTGGIPEIINGRNGLLFSAGDVTSLAKAMEASQETDTGKEARKTIHSSFTTGSMVNGVKSIYRQLE